MFELIYTATSKGLLQGRSGFTTVAMTQGFPPNLIPAIENMSGFRNLYMPGDPHAAENPVNCTYQQVRFGSSVLRVVSQIEYAGLSYTGRSNTLAHHYVFSADDPLWAMYSPASLLLNAENFPPWQGEPRLLPEKTQLTAAPLPAGCAAWERLTGSADWGKIIAEMIKRKMAPAVVLQFAPLRHRKADLLALIAEVSAQLSPEERADFTFSTYCYQSAIGNPVFLRAYPENSTLLESIKYLHQEHVLVLGEKNEIPENFQELLRHPKLSEPPPPPPLRETKPVKPVVQSPVLPKKPRKSSPAPSVAMPQKSATAPSSHRFWWIGGISAALLLILSGSFAAAYYAWQAKHPAAPVSAPLPVVGPAAKSAVAPPPVKKTSVSPRKTHPKPASVNVEPMKRPVVNDEERFEFYLALHDGKKEIALPKALKNGVLKRVALKNEYGVLPDKVGKIFAVCNNSVTICDKKTDDTDPLNPSVLPDSEKIVLVLQVKDGMMSIDPAEKADEIVSFDFSVGDATFVFSNEFDTYDEHIQKKKAITRQLSTGGELKISVTYPDSEFVTREIRKKYRLNVVIDNHPGPLEIDALFHLSQFDLLEEFIKKRDNVNICKEKLKDADNVLNKAEKTLKESKLLSKKSASIEKKYDDEELVNLLQKVKEKVLSDHEFDEMKKQVNVRIFAKRENSSEKGWQSDQKIIGNGIADHQEKLKKRNEANLYKETCIANQKKAEKEFSAAKNRFKQYPWAMEVLAKHAENDEKSLRETMRKKYLDRIKIELVRKSQK